jgi:hypothetical protein
VNHPFQNLFFALSSTFLAVALIGCIWMFGQSFGNPRPLKKRLLAIGTALVLLFFAHMGGGWMEVGLGFPGLIGILLIFLVIRLRAELRVQKEISENTVTSFLLVLIAGAMLARMALRARIYDFGFYQAAFSGMVIPAFVAAELPRWIKSSSQGRRVALLSWLALIGSGCVSIASMSHSFRSMQTQSVGVGKDRFYSFNPQFDATGQLVDWAIKKLESTPLNSTVLVLPEGSLINYESRRRYPLRDWIPLTGGSTDKEAAAFLTDLRQSPPDYVVLISRPMPEYGISQFGAVGTPSHLILNWVNENYQSVASKGYTPFRSDNKKGAVILKKIQQPVSGRE